MGLFFGRKRRSKKKTSITRYIPFMRFLGPGISIGGIVTAAFMLLTGRIDLSTLDVLRGTSASAEMAPSKGPDAVDLSSLGERSSELLRIATFNIQQFDRQKASDPNIMGVLARTMSQFDVIAIQELAGGDAAPIQALIDQLQKSGARYSATVSEPVGRDANAESYAFVWDETRIALVPRSAYVVQDPADRMHREPMVASFESRVGLADGRRPFRFTLINVHTSPLETETSAIEHELNVLDDVFVRVRQYDYESTGEEDCILLGALNVNRAGLRELGQVPDVESIAGDAPTNTLRDQTYDHILIDRRMTREFTGRFGVVDLQSVFSLTEQQALMVSDHQPLWAEFSAHELPTFDPAAAAQQPTLR